MNIDADKVAADLESIQRRKATLQQQVADLEVRELELAAFLKWAERYAVQTETQTRSHKGRKSRAAENKRQRKGGGIPFQPHRFPPQPIPEGFQSQHRRTRLLQVILDKFEPDSIITAGSVHEKIGDFPMPEHVKPLHHLSAVLLHEKGPGAVLEKVEPGKWRVKPNAMELLQSRVAAEIAQGQEAETRRDAVQ